MYYCRKIPIFRLPKLKTSNDTHRKCENFSSLILIFQMGLESWEIFTSFDEIPSRFVMAFEYKCDNFLGITLSSESCLFQTHFGGGAVD